MDWSAFWQHADQYAAAREAAIAADGGAGWEHADCDHGNGYCQY